MDVPLSLFSGWDTELSPPDIPEGASPQNNDVVFTPGSVATRPGLNRVFVAPVSALGPFSYEKSFVSPAGTIYNLYMSMGDGILWVENLNTNPGIATSLWQSAGAAYASSVTAQGSEYIALSDGQHGVDIPLEFDGENLYRITQDGPGAPPAIQSVPLPPSSLALSAANNIAISAAISTGPFVIGGVTSYTYISVTFSSPNPMIAVGQYGTYASTGSSPYNGSGVIVYALAYTGANVTGALLAYGGTVAGPDTGGVLALGGVTLSRGMNTVTATTATAHGLQKGYQAQISGVPTYYLPLNILSIVLDNEANPGIATVTTTLPHGLLPQNIITLSGVQSVAVGGGVSNVAFAGNFITITTISDHGLAIGSEVVIDLATTISANGQWEVAAVPSPTTFTYAFVSTVAAFSVADTGTVTYIWPLASVDPALDYWTVQTAPTPTSFTIQIDYTDGTWADGVIGFQWNGTFYVTAVLSDTEFQYQQYGPSASTTSTGIVTPYGQATPGIHQLQVSFLQPNGQTITAPSPPVTWVANGGQYVQISGLPVGPNGTLARVLQFTGAGGAYFFYIPVPAQANGLVVSTATQINDNTTTSVLLDFSDNTLFAATACSKPGNNLSAQNVLGPCAGMFTYASRLLAWGNRNKVTNLLNLGFDGGPPSGIPPGWSELNPGGVCASGRLANVYQITVGAHEFAAGAIEQGAAYDAYGAPIFLANKAYSVRVWLKASTATGLSALSFNISLTSASTSYLNEATIPGSSISTAAQGSFVEIAFPSLTPITIPSDLVLQFGVGNSGAASGIVISVDDMEPFFTAQPYNQNQAWISYAENFGGFDGNTGFIGPVDDQSPLMNFGVLRQTLYMVSGTGLHETQDNGQTEPGDWTVNQVSDDCGAFSIASVARNPQGIGSAGKDWMMWSGPDGAQIFTGQKPMKVSQEIQSVWDAIPAANAYQCWVKNWESAKWCFFGIPAPGSTMQVLVLDYRNIDGAAIAEYPPIHISFTGKMIVSDLTRKWTGWTIPAWCGELIYRNVVAQPQIAFGALTPSGGANSYVLNAAQYNDDDFGVIPASYTTYFFVSHEMEQALQVGSHRHIYTLAQAFIAGVGTWTLTPLAAALTNAFPASGPWPLAAEPIFDVDYGINIETTRCAFTIQAQPIDGLNSYFKLQKLVINMAKSPWMPSRGSMTGSY